MGADALRGGAGNDLYFADAGDVLTEGIGAGTDEVRTAAASFTLIPNIEHLTGTSSTGQVLTGNGMQNRITGAGGNDILYGVSGKDVLDGGAGDDVLDGGAFADTLKGGLGNDMFVYRSASDSARGQSDVISDFTLGDRISLNPIDADGNAANGNQDFRFVGAAKFSGSAGELRAFADVSQAGTWFVEADTNGDRVADLAITVVTQAGHQLNAADFWF
ncbi:hypothetical protein C7I55_17580 [Sphingomonas deserti]|uniref:Peptidase M10 serralysin C-terminal domain-containing protein n=2 Tax=Allosphingosinicella deserti TaxID=2116704 RepID=A0A2P7QK00_9SPHN|nr:hypothetical protein C7I55_17580 [Sphingomonas deserti]